MHNSPGLSGEPDLIDACLLSRGLERPRQETEGRFNRALREAKVHGSSIQTFNIIPQFGIRNSL